MNNEGKQLGIRGSFIKHVCDKRYGYKTATSKKDGYKFKFEYISDYEYQRRMADKHDDKICQKNKQPGSVLILAIIISKKQMWQKKKKTTRLYYFYFINIYIFCKSFNGTQLLKSSLYSFHLTKACLFIIFFIIFPDDFFNSEYILFGF